MENCLDKCTCAGRVERLGGHQAPVEDGAEEGLDGKVGVDAGRELTGGDPFGDEFVQAAAPSGRVAMMEIP